MTKLSSLSLEAMCTGLRSGDFSCRELLAAHIERIRACDNLQAFLEVSTDKALARADLLDREPSNQRSAPLYGIPVAIKDMILTKGTSSTAGSQILNQFVSPYDATVVEKLTAAKGIVLGKTNLDEFGMGSSTEHSAYTTTLNPWNTSKVPGGSSGGSAVAVASGQAPAALGTDTGGSVRQPASFCGVVGIKPSYGRVSRWGVVAYASSLDQVGVLTRTVRDSALVTRTIAGHDPRDATSHPVEVPDFVAATCGDVRDMRIGIPREYFVEGIDPQVEKAVKAALETLQDQGATLVDISLPHTQYALAVYYIIAPAEASSNLARYDGVRYGARAKSPRDLLDLYTRTRSEGFGTEVKRRILIGTYVLSTGYYDQYYAHAQKVRTLVTQDFERAFYSDCDLIACPTAPTTAFSLDDMTQDPLAMYLNDAYTVPVNLAGLPAMSLPCGFDSTGLPIGLQLIGRAFDEERIFCAAGVYERSTEWHKRLPCNVEFSEVRG